MVNYNKQHSLTYFSHIFVHTDYNCLMQCAVLKLEKPLPSRFPRVRHRGQYLKPSYRTKGEELAILMKVGVKNSLLQSQ